MMLYQHDPCKGIRIIDEQTANWSRTQGVDFVTNWLSSGIKFNAIISNDDEMVIMAIQALRAAGRNAKDYVIAGVNATQDALAAMQAGDLHVTVFQDAVGQGKRALDATLEFARGKAPTKRFIFPFNLSRRRT